MPNESGLWKAFKDKAPRDLWLMRVENVMKSGMPDVYGSTIYAGGFWVELKAPTAPKRPTTKLLGAQGLNPHQINWHIKADNNGTIGWILTRCSEGNLYLVDSSHAREINNYPPSVMREASQANTWLEIFERLKR